MSKWQVLILAVALMMLAGAMSQGKGHPQPEQTEFSAEDAVVNKPVVIPDDVLAILCQDGFVSGTLDSPSDKIPPSWFSASVIHLGDPREEDLVVEAQGELRGANVIMF
jgi:hypothetical protein